jgi:putative FmdB family regulatory protein
MPIYEFVCQECGVHYEQMQSFSATTLPPCPACHSHHVARMLGRPAIHFKGSGWYITDSKKSSKESATGSGDSSEKSDKNGKVEGGAKAVETPVDKSAKESTATKAPAPEA